jgi:hypothetical protein
MALLTWEFHQPLQNGNSNIFVTVFEVYSRSAGFSWWWWQFVHLPSNGGEIFFASNFIFIPALFLFALAVNPLTSQVKFKAPEVALLVVGFLLFLFLNLAPSGVGGWEMRGTWIARLYQPVFPALVLYIARWWQDLPKLTRPWSVLIGAAIGAASLGNAFIVFGPILGDPGGLSGSAFYRFYDHTDAHFLYEANLKRLGRRPLGFSGEMRSTIKPLSLQEIRAQRKARLDAGLQELLSIQHDVWANSESLRQVQIAYRQVGRALAEARSAIYARQLALRLARGELTPIEAQQQAKTVDDFVWPALKKIMDDPTLDVALAAPAPEPVPDNQVDEDASLKRDSKRLTDRQHDVSEAQNALAAAQSDLTAAREQIGQLDKAAAAAPAPH